MKDTVKKSEQREFRMHKDILFSIIQSQAGTLGKAILELVMNSIDAGCSTVDIKLTSKRVVVTDDGKGFVSRQEIDEFFETFGTPHTEGDARYGKFRMGRGQIMAFTRNKWTSGAFRMDVNVRDRGLQYTLDESNDIFAGCIVDGDLYDSLSASELIRETDGLRELCKYAPVPVIVNGERVSLNMEKEKWTYQDEFAYYLIRPAARQLDVYNLGVFVRHYYGDYGIGGVVVSKRQLEVNFARNDIITAKCKQWKAIAPKVREFAKQHEEKKPVQNDAYRDMMMQRLLTGNFESYQEMCDAMDNIKVITDYSGKHHSVKGLCRNITAYGGKIVLADSFSIKADRVHQKRMAMVISPKTNDRMKGLSLKKLFQRFIKNLTTLHGDASTKSWNYLDISYLDNAINAIGDLEKIAKSINDQHDMVEEKQLNKEEKLTLKVIREMASTVAYATDQTTRVIRVCKSESLRGFTDGSSYICIEREFLKVGGYTASIFQCFDAIKSLLLHEYLHDSDDSTGHGHPAEFYERFHDLSSDNERIQSFVHNAMHYYLKARRKAGLPMKTCHLNALDMVSMGGETENDEAADFPLVQVASPEQVQLAA